MKFSSGLAWVALLVSAATFLYGCDSQRRGGGGIIVGICNNGDLRPCTCPDGTASNQVCANDRFGACMCSPTGGMSDGGNGNMSDASDPQNDSGPGPMDSSMPPPDGGGEPIPDAGLPLDAAGMPDAGSNIGQSCTVSPDSCAPTSVCTGDATGATSCVQPGFAQLNQACNPTSNNCAVGQGTCVDLGFGARCYVGCDGVTPCANSGDICWLIGEAWGVCDLYQLCDPLTPGCPSDRTCSIAQSDGTCACSPRGNVQLNQPCMRPGMNCAPGQGLCLNVGDGPICYQVCDPNTTSTCTTGTCTALTGITWGICY